VFKNLIFVKSERIHAVEKGGMVAYEINPFIHA